VRKAIATTLLYLVIAGSNVVFAAPSEVEMVTQAKEAVGRSVKDGESMRVNIFSARPTPADPESFIVCGEVNAKNSYGAYSGFQRFSFSFLNNTPLLRLDEGGRSAQIIIEAFCSK